MEDLHHETICEIAEAFDLSEDEKKAFMAEFEDSDRSKKNRNKLSKWIRDVLKITTNNH